ncbi:Nn.00g004680.m01.CDS01 [Neocucurbitaria sp. VM-36]
MLFTTIALSALATSTLAFPFNQIEKRNGGRKSNNPQASLPECGPDTVTCRCPANSFYQTSSSYAFWPVSASEITRLTVNFLDTAWFGTAPERTEGNGTAVGAKRYLRAELPEGKNVELIMEELTELTYYPDGGYWMKFQMGDAPFWYEKEQRGNWGLLAGSWDIVDVREINGMAYMLWDIHVCFMDTYDLAGFHESGMNNLTTMLKAEGKIPQDASMIGPITF